MTEFVPGQRWSSEMEPALGVGRVQAVDGRRVHLHFPDAELVRIYATQNAPLRRVIFQVGDRVVDADGVDRTITQVTHANGLAIYWADDLRLPEDQLSGRLVLDAPKDRLMAGQHEPSAHFDLRRRVIEYRCRMARSPAHGFIGGRVDLIPHQFGIAAEVCARRAPRVLLADETGLGKTIEAGLILHRLVATGQVARALVIVPDALVVQWFVELARRFNLRFRLFEAESIRVPMGQPPAENLFADEPLALCGFDFVARASKSVAAQLLEGDWDLVVVDEAHHMQPGDALFKAVERLGQRVPGLILITATPGHLAAHSHFARLRLLDPHRYPDYRRFQAESETFGEIARLVQTLDGQGTIHPADRSRLARLLDLPVAAITADLGQADARRRMMRWVIDRHGTGRVMFKTTRRTVTGFPGRKAQLLPLDTDPADASFLGRLNRECLSDGAAEPAAGSFDLDADPRVDWLEGYLRSHREDKILLICRSARKVAALYDALERRINARIGRYHEAMTLVQRDRNAAWFAEADGASLLLCSEIGSEGRNFQFARKLVLFDLPWDADLLEQRIGRLDRIGQTGVVEVLVPYVRGTGGEVLARWYHDAMGAFANNVPAAGWVTRRLRHPLAALISESGAPVDPVRLSRLIHGGRVAVTRQQRRIETGRDRLLELDALPPDRLQKLIADIRAVDGDARFQPLIEALLDGYGISMEPLAAGVFRLVPDHRYGDPLSGFRPSGMSVTLDRGLALTREDLDFLTADHPLVNGAMDLYLGSGKGSAAFGYWPADGPPEILLELLFLLEGAGGANPMVTTALPLTLLRVVVTPHLDDGTAAFPASILLTEGPVDLFARLLPVAARLIPEMLAAGRRFAEAQAIPIKTAARQAAQQILDDTISRLISLEKRNAAVDRSSIEAARRERDAVLTAIDGAAVRLDALRLVARGDFP